MLEQGQLVKNRYVVERQIASSQNSTVYLAFDSAQACKKLAIKEVSRSAKDASGWSVEFSLAREVDMMRTLSHPLLVKLEDTFATDQFIYVIMEYVDGVTLERLIKDRGPASEGQVSNWMLQLCEVLGYLHSRVPAIIYRDVKPSNIMVQTNGRIKLIDLGIARSYKGGHTRDTRQLGTECYAPPEQYGSRQTDARSDIYAVGATMWHLLAGVTPPPDFNKPDVRWANRKVGEGFARVIIPRCTQLRPEDRYQNCHDLATDLKHYRDLTHDGLLQAKQSLTATVICAVLGVLLFLIGAILGLTGASGTVILPPALMVVGVVMLAACAIVFLAKDGTRLFLFSSSHKYAYDILVQPSRITGGLRGGQSGNLRGR